MSQMINCKKCGKLFNSTGFSDKCIDCYKEDEMTFDKIREYVKEHPGAKVFEVSTCLDISIKRIKQYLREGRLEIVEKNNHFLGCEKCGKPIQSGRYCDDCYKQALNSDMKVIYTEKFDSNKEHKINYMSKYENRKAASK